MTYVDQNQIIRQLHASNKRIAELEMEVTFHQAQSDRHSYDLSQLDTVNSILASRIKVLEEKLRRQKASISGQEKQWLQTKVYLYNYITKLQDELLDTKRQLSNAMYFSIREEGGLP